SHVHSVENWFLCAVILMASSAALSRDGGLPQFDIQKQCQKIQRAADELTGTKIPGVIDSCVKNEQSTRDKLTERWRLFRHWIKQVVFNRRVGHQAIPNGLGAWTQESTCERCASYGRLEAVPNGELAIGWLNHQCRRMPGAIETYRPIDAVRAVGLRLAFQ
ncbi:MAG: hypothetical protein WA592_22580, partial [Pseudolabrys sp.]